MIRDVKIERLTVSSLGNAVSWSDDGSFAIPNQENVMCIRPLTVSTDQSAIGTSATAVSKADERYDILNTDPLLPLKPLDEAETETYNIETFCSDDFVISTSWSPSGISSSRGCLLTVLTNQGDVILYELSNITKSPKWIRLDSCIALLRQTTGTTDKALLNRGIEIRDFIIQAISWSSRFPSADPLLDKWGTAYLACGTKYGTIVLYHSLIHDQKRQVTSPHFEITKTFKILQNQEISNPDDFWITKLEWSSWIKMPDSNYQYFSVIIVTTAQNSVLARPIIYDSRTKTFDTTLDTITLHEASRFLINSLSVHLHDQTGIIVVGVAQAPGVSLYMLTKTSLTKKSKKTPNIFVGAEPGKETLNSLALFNCGDYQVWVAGTASRVNTLLGIVTLSEDGDPSKTEFNEDLSGSSAIVSKSSTTPSISVQGNVLQAFLDRRTMLVNTEKTVSSGIINSSSSSYEIQCFGIVPHPINGDYMAILNRKLGEDELRYLLPSNSRIQLSFIPFLNEDETTTIIEEATTDSETTVKEIVIPDPKVIVKRLPSTLRSSSESTWWRIKALSNTIKQVKKRPIFMKLLIDELDEYITMNRKNIYYHGQDLKKAEENDDDSAFENYSKLLSDLNEKFYFEKFYDVLRLTIHLKRLALQMEENHKQLKLREFEKLSELNPSYGVEPPTMEPLFGADISVYEEEIEKSVQFILSELCFITLSHVSRKNAPEFGSEMERAIVQSFIAQLEKYFEDDRNQSDDDDSTFKNTRLDRSYVSQLSETCRTLLANPITPVSFDEDVEMEKGDDDVKPLVNGVGNISLKGDGFSEQFNFSSTQRDEIVSERGYPWRRCSITLLPLMYYEAKACDGCERQTSLLSSYYRDASRYQQEQLSNSKLLQLFLGRDTFDVCIYCGCRYTESV